MKNSKKSVLDNNIYLRTQVGIWAIESDEGREPRMYCDVDMLGLLGIDENTAPEDAYRIWYDNVDDEYYDEMETATDNMIAGRHAELEYPWHSPDGEIMRVRMNGIRNFDYRDGVRLEGTHQDITKIINVRKHSIVELLAALSEDFLDVLIIDPYTGGFDSYEDYSNGEYSRYSQDFYMGVDYMCENVVYPEDVDFAREMFSRDFLTETAESGGMTEFILRWTREGSGMQWVKNRIIAFEEAEGAKKLIVGVEDITRMKLNEEKMQSQQDRLEAALRDARSEANAKAIYLMNMAEKINTPVNAIIADAHIAENYIGDDEKVREAIENILKTGEKLRGISDDIMEMNKNEKSG